MMMTQRKPPKTLGRGKSWGSSVPGIVKNKNRIIQKSLHCYSFVLSGDWLYRSFSLSCTEDSGSSISGTPQLCRNIPGGDFFPLTCDELCPFHVNSPPEITITSKEHSMPVWSAEIITQLCHFLSLFFFSNRKKKNQTLGYFSVSHWEQRLLQLPSLQLMLIHSDRNLRKSYHTLPAPFEGSTGTRIPQGENRRKETLASAHPGAV